MTGYGNAKLSLSNNPYEINILSLNSRNIDINVRTPQILKNLEIEIRKLLTEKLIRGKIECIISYDKAAGNPIPILNESVLCNYMEQINSFTLKYKISELENPLATLLKLPGVFELEKDKLTEEELQLFFNSLTEAIDQVIDFRKQEGEKTKNDIEAKISSIGKLVNEIENLKDERDNNVRTQLYELIKQLPNDIELDRNRWEQEILYYLDRLDINEELQRLKAHIEYFKNELHYEKNITKGKKLNFISQEILRETNTLGNKSNYLPIQQKVVNIKDDLEKIKEQLNNVL